MSFFGRGRSGGRRVGMILDWDWVWRRMRRRRSMRVRRRRISGVCCLSIVIW